MPPTPLSSREIRTVYAARRVLHGQFLALHVRPDGDNGGAVTRTAVVAGRRVGRAVDRNRAKRRLRALLAVQELPGGADVVLAAKPQSGRVPFPVLMRDYRRLSDRLAAGLRRPR